MDGVLVGKYKIYYRTLGKGSPTIIFSSGTGFPADEWFNSHIAPALAKKVKVVAYDRVFTFNSCPNPNDYICPFEAEVIAYFCFESQQVLRIHGQVRLIQGDLADMDMKESQRQ